MSDPSSRRHWSHATRRGSGGLILVVLVALAIVLALYFGNFGGSGSYTQQLSGARKAGRQVAVDMNTQQWVTLIAAYRLQNNKLPAAAADLDSPGAFVDPWGSPVVFSFSEQGGQTMVTFTSPGPNGLAGDEDDVKKTVPVPG